MKRQSWSVFIFAYNEAEALPFVVQETFVVLESMALPKFEVLLIDDGSEDETEAVLEKLKKDYPSLKIIKHSSNKGIGGSLITGYHSSSMDLICGIPGDGQFEVGQLGSVGSVGVNEVVSFYRPQKPGYNIYRHLLTLINKSINNYLLNLSLKDVNWVKVYRKEQLNGISISSESSFVESEICSKLSQQGVAFREIPSPYLPRRGGKSHGGSLGNVARNAKDSLTHVGKNWLKNYK